MISLHVTRRSLGRWSAAGMLALAGACSADEAPRRGQLMLALQTDMSIPKDVTHIRVKTKLNSQVRDEFDFQIAPDGKFHIPGTIAIVEGTTPNPVVSVEVIGIREHGTGNFEARTFSKSTTSIPRERTVLLEIPVQWLCDDTAVDDGTGEYLSSCSAGPDGEERACVAGACEPVSVDGSKLPDYKPALVFGGGSNALDPLARCFDTVSCFDRGGDVDPADIGKDCTLTLDDDGLPLNVGLRMPDGTDGICHGAKGLTPPCYVPLDQSDRWGWHLDDGAPKGKRKVVLPKGVCAKLDDGKIEALVVSTACETKTSQYGTCGAWSETKEGGAPGSGGSGGNGAGGSSGRGGSSNGGSSGLSGEGGMAGETSGSGGTGGSGGGSAGGVAKAGSGGIDGSGDAGGPASGATGNVGGSNSAGGTTGGTANGQAGDNGTAGAAGALPGIDEWNCDVSTYGTGDGCDCGCGAPDPDCTSTNVGDCDFCDGAGTCAVDLDSTHTASSCYGIDLTHNWRCGVSAWACAPLAFGSGNACDCGCGAPDPDCTSSSASACDDCSDPDSCAGGDCSVISSSDNTTCSPAP